MLEAETAVIAALTDAGFALAPERLLPPPRHVLGALDDPIVPDGFALRHVEFGEAEPRARVHRAGWADFGRLHDGDVRGGHGDLAVSTELDWVVEAPTKSSSRRHSAGWTRSTRRGCSSRLAVHRRTAEKASPVPSTWPVSGDARCRRSDGHVNPRGDDGYPVPGRLYRSIGFQPGPRTVSYVRAGASRTQSS